MLTFLSGSSNYEELLMFYSINFWNDVLIYA